MVRKRDKKRVADAVLEKEKNRAVGQVFDARFSWAEMADAVADVYLGVSLSHRLVYYEAYMTIVHFLEHPHSARRHRMVFPTVAHGNLRIRGCGYVHRLAVSLRDWICSSACHSQPASSSAYNDGRLAGISYQIS
jgi:hypothetical protein